MLAVSNLNGSVVHLVSLVVAHIEEGVCNQYRVAWVAAMYDDECRVVLARLSGIRELKVYLVSVYTVESAESVCLVSIKSCVWRFGLYRGVIQTPYLCQTCEVEAISAIPVDLKVVGAIIDVAVEFKAVLHLWISSKPSSSRHSSVFNAAFWRAFVCLCRRSQCRKRSNA